MPTLNTRVKILRSYSFFNKRFGDEYSNENISKFIAGFVEYNKTDVKKRLLEIETTWSQIESEYKKRMDAIFGCDYPLQQLTAYLTTNDRCAIAPDYFFVTAYSKQPMRILCHELLHFYTYYVFGEDLKTMPEKKQYDIKESLTELLNFEFLDIIEAPEVGYVGHEKIRGYIGDNWKNEKSISEIFKQLSNNYTDYIDV